MTQLHATDSVPRRESAFVALAQVGISMALYTPLVNLLPRIVALIVGTGRESASFAMVAGTGAFVAMLTNIAVGALADRSLAKRGSRRSWIILGIIAGTAGLLIAGQSDSISDVTIGWLLTQFGINCTYCVVTAYIPDRVPAEKRGMMSAWFALGQTVGLIIGLGFVVATSFPLVTDFLFIAFGYLILTLPALRLSTLSPSEHLPATSPTFRSLIAFGPFTRDFGYAWIVRFLATFGNATAVIYLLYYISNSLKLPHASVVEACAVLGAVVFTVFTSIFFGRSSDRTGRRKRYVAGALIGMSLAYVTLAWWRSLIGVIVAASVLGLGYGTYLSVDQALITEVLSDKSHYARDLGVLNLANAGPQIVAPALAAAVVSTSAGYTGLYLVVAVVMLIGLFPLALIRAVA